jgi:hypothetical protein
MPSLLVFTSNSAPSIRCGHFIGSSANRIILLPDAAALHGASTIFLVALMRAVPYVEGRDIPRQRRQIKAQRDN